MSLRDRYNRGGDGRLELLDSYLTYLGDRTGNSWRDRTGASRTDLTRCLYLFAAWAALQHVVISHDPSMLVIAGVALLSIFGVLKSRGGVVEQIQVEALGLPRRTFVILRVWLLVLGLFSLAMALGDLAVTLQSGAPLTLQAGQSWLLGLSLTALQTSDYISRTNPIFPSGGMRLRR
ncbi:MAG: hypothetical protein ACJ789_19135 [Thermomicrobiales bacterium]